MKKMKSQRKYLMKLCMNLAPHAGSEFIPHDSRQVFCCPQCRINFYNDKRKVDNATRFAHERVLRRIDKQLEILYMRYFNGKWCSVHKGLLAFVQVDVINFCVTGSYNKITGCQISWFYSYGVSMDPKDNNYFLIYKK